MSTIQQSLSGTAPAIETTDRAPIVIDVSLVLGVKGTFPNVSARTMDSSPVSFEGEFLPNAQSGMHLHPNQEESYQIVSGTLDLWLDGKWHSLSDGQRISIPKGSRHAFRNSSGKSVRLINTHNPGLRFVEYLQGMERLTLAGKLTGISGFRNTLYLSLYVTQYSDLLIILSPPPQVIKMTAGLARLLGYSTK